MPVRPTPADCEAADAAQGPEPDAHLRNRFGCGPSRRRRRKTPRYGPSLRCEPIRSIASQAGSFATAQPRASSACSHKTWITAMRGLRIDPDTGEGTAADSLMPSISQAEFDLRFGTEVQCIEAVARWRWPDGFRCSKCGHDKCYRLANRGLRQCARCRRQNSAIAGTPLNNTKLPLRTWFRGLHILETCGERDVRVDALASSLSISYNAAWRMKRTLVRLMRDRDRPLTTA